MKRYLIKETPNLIGETVRLAGWVSVRRDHGKLIFIDLRDRSGLIQVVIIPDKEAAYQTAKTIKNEAVIEVEGLVKSRPGGSSNDKLSTGKVEIEAESLKIITLPTGELPVDISEETLNIRLETLLDNRNLTLRNDKIKSIFRIYSEMLHAYDEAMRQGGFTEIKTPKIVNSATEGGANFFKIKYFDREAFLAQSPQFYKQAGVALFERVFEVGSVFRAEPHFTTRHVNEYIGLDAEMGFIESFEDVMDELERVMNNLFDHLIKNCGEDLAKYSAEILPAGKIPRLKLTEALGILEREYAKKVENMDIDSEGERLIGEWVKKKFNSDLVFLTHYPRTLRPFYSMPSPDPEYTETFDLIYRGTEIASGGERIFRYQELVDNIKKRGMNPEQFSSYLEIFKYGMPRHGGWGLGSERIVQKILGLGSIKEAILFPRDVKRLMP